MALLLEFYGVELLAQTRLSLSKSGYNQIMSLAQYDREIERLLEPRLAHKRQPTPEWLVRARELRENARKQGLKLKDFSPEQAVAMLPPLAGGAASFNVVVDTTAPANAALLLNGGAAYTSSASITAQLSTDDTPTTGYQILIWGSVDTGANASIQTTQGASTWITPGSFPASQAVTLSSGGGLKTINARIRDDVWNETATLTQTITLDTDVPTVNWTSGPDVSKISTVSGKRVVNATFTVGSEAITAWEIAVVANSASLRGSGTVISTTNGSTGVTGGALAASATQAVSLDARDIQVASAGEGTKVIKIFVQDVTGNWST